MDGPKYWHPLTSWSVWRVTENLRWKCREHSHGGDDIFLQQKWKRQKMLEDGSFDNEEKWVGVPLAEGD